MKFSVEFKPELCAFKDSTRPNLTQTHLDTTGKRLIATDGHRMCVVPCVPESGDAPGAVSAPALDAARKLAKKLRVDTAEMTVGEKMLTLADASTLPRENLGQFPGADQVIPRFTEDTEGTVTVAFDSALLAGLAKAIGTEQVVLTFKIDDADRGPILVRPLYPQSTEFGVLMPIGRRKEK